MRIIFASSEALPYWKTGGLADVAHALPAALAGREHDVRIMLPYYRTIRESELPLEDGGEGIIPWPGGDIPVRYWLHTPEQGAPALLVDQPGFFDVHQPYGAATEDPAWTGVRFAFFSRCVVERARAWGADVVHSNDWQTGLVPLYGILDGTPAATVFAVHNLGYQGNFNPVILDAIGIPRAFQRQENGLEFWGNASFMKAGLALADRLVTVSPTYAMEVQTNDGGFGFDGLLRFRHRLLHGILNGIDCDVWNPRRDPELPERYDVRGIKTKELVRAQLLREIGLEDHGPLFALVTRLAYQKGVDLLLEALPAILELGASLAVLGDGDLAYEAALADVAAAHPGRVAAYTGFNDRLAHLLYAGADFFLMPSRYEPCGLGQMIAHRYGTVPIVRRTGGLADTVVEGSTGYTFEEPTPQALLGAVRKAVRGWRSRRWNALRRRCMALDWCWEQSARKYEEVYRMAIGV